MTVYGSAPQGTPTALKVLVGMAAVVALTAIVVVWSRMGDADPAAELVASPTSVATIPATPAATPSLVPATKVSSAPVKFSTGSWVLSLKGGSGRFLTVDGGFAAMSSGQRTVLTAVKGLADTSCFSIRAPNGTYLRHSNYRLRFDNPDSSELYRKDATFCPLSGGPAGAVRLRSVNFPAYVIHSRGKELYIDRRDGSAAFDADSSFTIERA